MGCLVKLPKFCTGRLGKVCEVIVVVKANLVQAHHMFILALDIVNLQW